jgi:hypothetical protein
MILHTVFISYDRLELTQKAVETYLETVSVPYSYLIVDNGSGKEVTRWLQSHDEHPSLELGENKYPGFACNRGFEQAPSNATFLHRADNDFSFLPGWCEEVARRFVDQFVGQVGLRTGPEEMHEAWNVGGNCIIRRSLWDMGLRYDETPWPELPAGYSEDSFMSPEVKKMGYSWTRVKRPCIVSLASGDWDDDYYRKSYGARHIPPPKKS